MKDILFSTCSLQVYQKTTHLKGINLRPHSQIKSHLQSFLPFPGAETSLLKLGRFWLLTLLLPCLKFLKFSVPPDGPWVSIGRWAGKLTTAHISLPHSTWLCVSTVIGYKTHTHSQKPILQSEQTLYLNSSRITHTHTHTHTQKPILQSEETLLSKWNSTWSFFNVAGSKGWATPSKAHTVESLKW